MEKQSHFKQCLSKHVKNLGILFRYEKSALFTIFFFLGGGGEEEGDSLN